MKEAKTTKLKFFWVAAGVIILFGLLIALHWPEITAWRQGRVDMLLRQANEQRSDQAKYSYLSQAITLSPHDPLAVQAMAQFWLSRGEVDQAIRTYRLGIDKPNYVALGNLALKAQSYGPALDFYKRSNKADASANGLIGESVANYNLDKISDGCNKAIQASKSDLSSEPAKSALKSCVILGGTSAEAIQLAGNAVLTPRQEAYILLDANIYKQAEQRLLALSEKTTGDYLVLARLTAARGDIAGAARLAEQGIELDKSNEDLNKALVQYYGALGDKTKQGLYQTRLDELLVINAVH